MKKFFTLLMTFLLRSVLMLGNLTASYAQEGSSEEFTLEEITVTAEKRTTDVQKTALSISAISRENISEMAQNTLEAALRDIASVELGYGNRGAWVNIRGVGHYVDTSLADSAVAIIEDNIYNGNSLASFGNMYDIQRIEVLRGPQGTLYGRNATGGTVNVISNSPTRKFEMTGNLQIGDYNLKHLDGALNFPISEKWAGRVAFLRETRDGYLSSGDLDSNALGARIKLLYEPNDRLSVLATHNYNWQNDHGSNTVPVPGSAGNLPRLGPAPGFGYTKPDANKDGVADDFIDADLNKTDDLDGEGWPDGDGIADLVQTGWVVLAGADPWTVDELHPARSSYSLKKAYSLEINMDFDWGVLTAIPAYAESYSHNVDDHLNGLSEQSGQIAYDLGEGQKNSREQTSGELRFASSADSDWVRLVGYYYMKSQRGRWGDQEVDALSWADNKYHTQMKQNPITSSAYFGQTTYPVTDRFRVTGGIRFANDKEKRNFRIGASDLTGAPFYDTGWMTYNSDVNSTTYKAGVEFDAAERSMLYVQIATGFKQGGLNNTAPPEPFKPEELVAYELGIKNRFLENRMQLNLEGYY
jgi:iron complex outermembrane recepter protein